MSVQAQRGNAGAGAAPTPRTCSTAADYPDLLVGLGEPDDAAVWRLDDERALVVTTDFFTPVVDDPYDYGAIAAANACRMSTPWAGSPSWRLNIAALPPDLPAEISGRDPARRRGKGARGRGGDRRRAHRPGQGAQVRAGGDRASSIPRRCSPRAGSGPGDRLVLTKPLGFGVTTTALKRDKADPADVAEVVGWMKRLNDRASRLAVEFGLRGGTDVTGYSLLGHGWRWPGLRVGLRFQFQAIPFLSGARRYAESRTFPGGAWTTACTSARASSFEPGIDRAARCCSSIRRPAAGCCWPSRPASWRPSWSAPAQVGQPLWVVGEAVEGQGILVV